MSIRNHIFFYFMILFALCCCNKDDVIEDKHQKPEIILDNETGVYTVKKDCELTISPQFKNLGDGIITWTLGKKIVCRTESFSTQWNELGEFYITIAAQNQYGRVQEEIRVDVIEKTPPVVELKIPSEGLKVLIDQEFVFSPVYQYDTLEEFKVEWMINGKKVSNEKTYTWEPTSLGFYDFIIEAGNIDGITRKEFKVEVVETMPYKVDFPKPYYMAETNTRYTFKDRPVFLIPNLSYFEVPSFEWQVDGEKVDNTESFFKFTPVKSGIYTVSVIVTDGMTDNSVKADVTIDCVSASEGDRYRPANGSSRAEQNKIYEYLPAPGQFIGEPKDFTGNENTFADAIQWATARLNEKNYVSLGGFGGYIIVGFDHSIAARGLEYDFAIQGNAFGGADESGQSNEPGIVWVMQDVNGNGLPDDEWYELRGSETGKSGTIQNYWVTYYKPAPKRDVQWVDSEGKSGYVAYNIYHTQDYYYPNWMMNKESYTLYGTRLNARNTMDSGTGYWSNNPYDWGYADNIGTDNLAGADGYTGAGQRNGFKISNAMFSDLSPIKLEYIDFIKVQCGVNASSGRLGEISTEVFNFQDLSINP